jgi:hypothetical protein
MTGAVALVVPLPLSSNRPIRVGASVLFSFSDRSSINTLSLLPKTLYWMHAHDSSDGMSQEELNEALHALGWRQADLCRKAGLHKDTPSRWLSGKTEIPAWVPAYLGAMLEIQRLHKEYVQV